LIADMTSLKELDPLNNAILAPDGKVRESVLAIVAPIVQPLVNALIADLDLTANGWWWCGCRGTRDDWLQLPFLCAWFSPILIDRCLSACVYR
jgi:hypothetical protein